VSEGNIISFKVFVNSRGVLMTEYSKLPLDKIATVFDLEDISLIKKIINGVAAKVDNLHENLEKELEALN
tara:strand:+ start:315 stop:524 length:210 start_codon:yes stop_codon:yes gene_type:complete